MRSSSESEPSISTSVTAWCGSTPTRTARAVFSTSHGDDHVVVSKDAVIAADGIHSVAACSALSRRRATPLERIVALARDRRG